MSEETGRPAILPTVSKQEQQVLVREGAHKWSKAEVMALKEYCCPKDASPSEILSFWFVCKKTGLDPFMRQIHLVRYGAGEGDEGRGRCTIQVGIDGFRQVSMEAPGFAGIDETLFTGEATSDGPNGSIKHPLIAKTTVWRYLNGEKIPFIGVARWEEFSKWVKDKKTQKRRLNSMWATMPYNQLGKCSEAQGHRKSAPVKLSCVYTPEELGTVIDVVGVVQSGPSQPQALGDSSKKSSTKGGAVARDLWNRLMNSNGGNQTAAEAQLKRLTTFSDNAGKVIEGTTDWSRLSDAWAKKTIERLNKAQEDDPKFGD